MTRAGSRNVRGLVLLTAGLVVFPFAFPQQWIVNIAFFTVMYAALASGWNVIGGYAGYPALGPVAFFGVGAYAMAIAVSRIGIGSGWWEFAIVPAIGLFAAAVAAPLGWVAFRTRGMAFAIVTLTLLFVVQALAFNLRSLTNGAMGLVLGVAPFSPASYDVPFYLVMAGILVIALALSMWIKGTKLGLALRTIRDDEDKARGLGINTMFAKLVAFSVMAGVAAMAGGVWAYYIGSVYPQFAVDPIIDIGLILTAYLGGIGTVWGPLVGTALLIPAQQYMAYSLGANDVYLVAYAAIFLVVIVFLPRGILPSLGDLFSRWSARRSASANPSGRAAAPPADVRGA